MVRNGLRLTVCCALALAGCHHAGSGQPRGYVDAFIAPMKSVNMAIAPMSMGGLVGASGRFVAVNHRLDVISAEPELEKDWKAVIDFCGTLQCEIVSSTITTKTHDSPPSGSTALRVAPPDFEKLVSYIEKHGSVVRHTTQSDDRTTAVIDTDAKIKNLTSFRDNLRTMLGKPSATVKDFVEIQQQLTDVQSQLDSETAQRKILANETEKIAVEIAYSVERQSAASSQGMAAIGNAIRESGNVLADSIASLITMVVAVIPWLILIVPLCWFLARIWRRMRRARSQRTPGAE